MTDFIEDEDRPWLYGGCDGCPLNPPKVVRGYGIHGGIAVVGESPGRLEVEQGRPFIGASGRLIRAVLQGCGQDPEAVYWTNALLCHPPGVVNRDAVLSCNSRLHEEIEMAGVTKVLLLGGIALQAFLAPTKPVSIMKKRGEGFMVRSGRQVLYALATYHPAAVLRSTDLFRDLANDVEKFLCHDAPIKPPKPHVFVSWTPKKALQNLEPLLGASKISCDIETTGFSTVGDMIVSTGFGVQRNDGEYESHIVPAHVLRDPEVEPLLIEILNNHPGILILHNMKFDLRFEQTLYGVPIKPKIGHIDDTMLMSYVLDERPASPHGLKALARYHFDAPDYAFDFDTFFANTDLQKADYEKLFYYQGLDCMYTLMLHDLFAPKIDESTRRLLDTLMYPASFAFQDIENHGLLVDMAYVQKWGRGLERESNAQLAEIVKLVEETTGLQEFNPASPVQVKKLIYQIWKVPQQMTMFSKSKQWKQEVGNSQWPTGSTVLSRIAETINDPVRYKILIGIRNWRQVKTLVNTNVKGLIRATDSDSRVRSFFFLHGSVTGRLSSTKPNLQNIPSRRGTEAEQAFRAPDGWSIIAADYSQLELRVLACFSKDAGLAYVFNHGLDIHSEVGSKIFEKPPDQITVMERKLTKTMVFGVLYGRGAESIILGHEVAYMVREGGGHRWTKDEAKDFQRKLLASYPGMNDYFNKAKRDAIEQHFVESPTGRKRRFPFITDTNRPEILRQAVNAPIQGTASDICLDGLVRLHKVLPKGKAHLLSMIHDAILLEVRNDVLDDVLLLVKRTMEDVQLIDAIVPFRIEMKAGPNWGLVKKVDAAALIQRLAS